MDPIYYLAALLVVLALLVIYAFTQNGKLKSDIEDYKASAGFNQRQLDIEIDSHQKTRNQLRTVVNERDTLKGAASTNDRAFDDTNGRLYTAGKNLALLQTAIKAARGAGKIAPTKRQELNTAVDTSLDLLVKSFPKKVEADPSPQTPKNVNPTPAK